MPASVQIMVWRRTGDKPLSKPVVAYLTATYICHSASASMSYMMTCVIVHLMHDEIFWLVMIVISPNLTLIIPTRLIHDNEVTEDMEDLPLKCYIIIQNHIFLPWRLKYTYGRDVVGYCHLRLSSRCRHPAPGQDLIPLQRLHVFAHSRDPHPAIKW